MLLLLVMPGWGIQSPARTPADLRPGADFVQPFRQLMINYERMSIRGE